MDRSWGGSHGVDLRKCLHCRSQPARRGRQFGFYLVSPVSAVWAARGRLQNAAGRPGQRVGHYVVCARYVLDIARELGDVHQLAALLGGPRLGRPAVVSGLWSLYSVNRLPSSMNRKWRIAWKQASSSLSKAEYLTCVLSSFLEKKPERLPWVRRPPPLLKSAADVVG